MVRLSQAAKLLGIPDQSFSPNELEDKVEVRLVQHDDSELLNNWFSGNLFQYRIDAVGPSFGSKSVLERN